MSMQIVSALAPTGKIELPKVIPLIPELRKGPHYPLESLPLVMQNAAYEIAVHLQVPEAMAAQCVIGAVNHIAMTRINARHPKDLHSKYGMPVSLFLLTLGESGDGKSQSHRLAEKIIREREYKSIREADKLQKQLESQLEASEGKEKKKLEEQLAALEPDRRIFSDITFEPLAGRFIRGMPSATWNTDEGGQLFGGHSFTSEQAASILGALTKAFDNGEFSRDRARSNEESSGVAYHRRLGINLLAQDIAIRKSLQNPLLREQGFLPRFLFAAPGSLAGRRYLNGQEVINARKNRAYGYTHLPVFWEKCRALMEIPEYIDIETSEVRPPVLELSDNAILVWAEHENKLESQLGPTGIYHRIRAFARRTGEIAIRLAANFAFVEGEKEISADSMRLAYQIAMHSLDEWLRYTDAVQPPQHIEDAYHVFSWLTDEKRGDGWHRFSLDKFGKSGPPAFRPAKKRDEVLATLAEHGYLMLTGEREFTINPRALAADSAENAES